MKEYKTLKMLGIPHKIEFSNELVNVLMRIAECRPFFINSLSSPLKVKLLRNAKIRAITYSNQIEGNPLEEDEVRRFIKKKRPTDKTHQIEIQNYSDALDFTEKLALNPRPISVNDFCDVQRLVTSGLLIKGQAGQVRTIPVSIVNAANGEKVDACPEPHTLKDALGELWNWLNETEDSNPYVRAFAFHFIAIAIHPFVDGNGRSVRLMQHLLLLRSGEELVKYIPSETAIMRRREEYYRVIRQTKKLDSLMPILEFLATCFCEAAEDVTEEAKKILKAKSLGPKERQAKIIKLARKKGEIRISEVVELFPKVPRRTLERDLEKLCREKKLKANGANKVRSYCLFQ